MIFVSENASYFLLVSPIFFGLTCIQTGKVIIRNYQMSLIYTKLQPKSFLIFIYLLYGKFWAQLG